MVEIAKETGAEEIHAFARSVPFPERAKRVVQEVDKRMIEGWICPKCGRALAPWMAECPCNNIKTVTSNTFTVTHEVGPCGYACEYRQPNGYCKFTACVNPKHGGDSDYGIGRNV